ncbi:Alpha beta hydrolase [Fragilaria crotonensis]|nr:Alpha beta hydrolase [Fragilaria crotonensis]
MDVETLEARLNDKRYMGKIMTLSDGRKLSYSEAGQVEHGYPVLFHVGVMCSSLAIVGFHDEALRLNLHIVSIDYPGVGESSPQTNREFSDWPNDVLEFVTFRWGPTQSLALLSHCMGAPHVLAVMGHPIMSHRISRVTLVSPWILLTTSNEEQPLARSWVHATVYDSVLPAFATALTSTDAAMSSSIPILSAPIASSQSTPLQLVAMERIVGYSHHQNQEGNRNMVRLALQRLRPQDALHFPYSFPVLVLCGDADPMVSVNRCRQFVQDQLDLVGARNTHQYGKVREASSDTKVDDNAEWTSDVPWLEYRTVTGANHISILSGANLTLILESFQ